MIRIQFLSLFIFWEYFLHLDWEEKEVGIWHNVTASVVCLKKYISLQIDIQQSTFIMLCLLKFIITNSFIEFQVTNEVYPNKFKPLSKNVLMSKLLSC